MAVWAKTALLGRYLSLFGPVKHRLDAWRKAADQLVPELREQALASIESKAFHCLGGAVYAAYPGVDQRIMLDAIVALQTISDYLDNLCDRVAVNDEKAFAQLHLSFLHALDPNLPLADYYCLYPYKETTYLNALVQTCRRQITQMPYYADYQPVINELAGYYCKLQVLKHLTPFGPSRLQQWAEQTFIKRGSQLLWNEWAAAAGSTLGIFFCFAASFHQYPAKIRRRMYEAYFPWVQGLHILLDYFIDRREDQIHGDLNFTFYHADPQHAISRMAYIYQKCKAVTASLPNAGFHQLVLEGMLAVYGSDPKLKEQGLASTYSKLLDTPAPQLLRSACRMLRSVRILT